MFIQRFIRVKYWILRTDGEQVGPKWCGQYLELEFELEEGEVYLENKLLNNQKPASDAIHEGNWFLNRKTGKMKALI